MRFASGYVHLEDGTDLEAAAYAINGMMIDGCEVHCSVALPPEGETL